MKQNTIPRLVQKDGRYGLMVDDAPYLVLAAQTRNSSAWPSRLPLLWPALEYDHVNTVEIPVYWNQVEAQPGKYDFTLVDMILAEARKHQVHVIPLWFATWKNGSQHFMPDWMKLDTVRYAHDVNKNGEAVDSPSPFATASLEADKSAFAALMRHLKEVDAQRTVIMVQVENEPGSYGTVRDYSPAAQKFFDAPVPPEILNAMHVTNAAPNATWQQAFGADADEYFNAWAVAKYVGQVAAAGKAVYPLPMYANAALRNPLMPGPAERLRERRADGQRASDMEGGGAVAGPAGAGQLPDRSGGVLKRFGAVPSRRQSAVSAGDGTSGECAVLLQGAGAGRHRVFAVGREHGGRVPPTDHSKARFDALEPWAQNYRLIGPMQREVARLNFEGKLQAVAEEKGKVSETLPFGTWNALVGYGATGRGPAVGNATPTGRALVAQLSENQFLITGYYCRIDFRPAGTEEQRRSQQIAIGNGQNPSALIDGKWQHRQFVRVEEGTYENGVFKFQRMWNGDETDWGLKFGDDPVVLRVTLATY